MELDELREMRALHRNASDHNEIERERARRAGRRMGEVFHAGERDRHDEAAEELDRRIEALIDGCGVVNPVSDALAGQLLQFAIPFGAIAGGLQRTLAHVVRDAVAEREAVLPRRRRIVVAD